MSLKHDIEEYPEMWSKEIVAAVEDYKNGKWNSKRKLRKFVNREISEYYYNELIERHKGANKTQKEKKRKKDEIYLNGYPIKEYLPILFFFSVIAAIYIIFSAIKNPNFWVEASAIYLLIAFFLYYYSNTSDIESKDHEIAQLKQEISKLESIRECDKHIIELLEKEVEQIKNKT